MALVVAGHGCFAEAPSPGAVASYDHYVAAVQSRIADEHRHPATFLADPAAACLHPGQVIVQPITPPGGLSLPGALLHDWRGVAFIPGANAAEFAAMLKDYGAYPRDFAPQVLAARATPQPGDRVSLRMRIRQHDVISVVLDGHYDVSFGQLDSAHGWSTSQSTAIDEIGTAGQPLSDKDQHGFLWRLDTWWSYEQYGSGLCVQIESVSLTRSIPPGLGWLVDPFVESVPRQSLDFTLRHACAAVRQRVLRPHDSIPGAKRPAQRDGGRSPGLQAGE